MDESQDAERPPKNPPRYLPRVWKAQPEPEPEAPVKKKKPKRDESGGQPSSARSASAKGGKKAKAGKAKGERDEDSEAPKGALVEATPTLDTYQARQTARIITGFVIAAVGLLFVLIIYFVVSGPKDEEEVSDEALLARAPSHDPAQAEREARFMLTRAREVVKRGNLKLTIAFLEKITRSYPQTTAASQANAALSQPRDELAAFLEKSSGVPTGPSPPKVVTGPSPPPTPAKTAQAPDAAAKTAPANPQLAKGSSPPAPSADMSRPPTGPSAPVPTGPAPPPPGSATASVPTGPSAPSAVAVNSPGEPPAKALPAGFHRAPGAAVSPAGWPLKIVCERDEATMVLVPGANYRMGRDDGELSEAPGHRVVLGTYYIDQHEVTVRQFDLFQKQDGIRSERVRALQKAQASASDSEDAPVTMVTAREAKDYATWAGKQLPTEAQWEIAARSGDGRLFPWGNDDPQWDKPREFRKIEPVCSHSRDVSPFGACDMAGNAWEWTKDWFDTKYYKQFRDAVADNPTGPPKPKSEQLAVRGCAKNWSVTKREGLKWTTRLPYLGFRCVLQVEGGGNAEAPGAGAPGAPGPARPFAPMPF